jgi:hypothetical protein
MGVEAGVIQWESTVGEWFPELAEVMRPEYRVRSPCLGERVVFESTLGTDILWCVLRESESGRCLGLLDGAHPICYAHIRGNTFRMACDPVCG